MPTAVEAPDFISCDELIRRHRGISTGQLRYWLMHRKVNGLQECVVQIGRRLLIDATAFARWLQSQGDREA